MESSDYNSIISTTLYSQKNTTTYGMYILKNFFTIYRGGFATVKLAINTQCNTQFVS